MSAPKPWERLEGETDNEWDLFVRFRHMPPSERGIRSLARLLKRKPTYASYLTRCANKHDWNERVAAWDNHMGTKQAERYEQVLEAEAEEMAKRHAKLAKEILDICHLKVQRIKQLVNLDIQNGGQLRSLDEIPMKAFSQMVQVSSTLERLSRDQSTQNVAVKLGISLPDTLPEDLHGEMLEGLRDRNLLPGMVTDEEMTEEVLGS